MRPTENIYSQVPCGDILTLPHSIKISKVYWGCNPIIFQKWISKILWSLNIVDIVHFEVMIIDVGMFDHWWIFVGMLTSPF